MLAGTEITFELPLPVCRDCSKSLERRVPTLFHKFLVVAVVTAAVFLVLIMALSQLTTRALFITDHLFVSSVVISVILVFLFYFRRRPNGKQTSFYQPVRISKLDREFVSGAIRKIGFGFTNPVYLREFSQANTQALKAGLVSAIKSS
jgi:cytochrome bd-type quinol oxidase subunit 1